MNNLKKISDGELGKYCAQARQDGGAIVFTYGIFDNITHETIGFLKQCKALGKTLIVSVLDDKKTKTKQTLKQRIELLASINYIDALVIHKTPVPLASIELIKPEVYCDTIDWGSNSKERDLVKKYGGKIHIIPITKDATLSRYLKTYYSNSRHGPAIFLDRDETINVNPKGFITKPDDFHFLPNAIKGLKTLVALGRFKLVIVTNQAGIARKIMTKKALKDIHQIMSNELEAAGVHIDGIYFCPHLAEELCICRKPEIGMLLEAARDLKINLAKSWFIGDKHIDVLTGQRANMRTIKIGEKIMGPYPPTFYAKDLLQAARFIEKNTI